MHRDNVNDLPAFLALARERSFTRAARKAGLSHSALSDTIRQLEDRLGVRLLMRTTRATAPTGAGQRLLDSIAPSFDEIEAQRGPKRAARQADGNDRDRGLGLCHPECALAKAQDVSPEVS